MFTGLIEELGKVSGFSRSDGFLRLTIEAPHVSQGLKIGDSISVNGVCLTVIDLKRSIFTVEAVAETLNRTTLGGLCVGEEVNLERPLRLDSRLGGHILMGHVDGRTRVVSKERIGESLLIKFNLPDGLGRYFVQKGSVGVDGVSLTIAELTDEYFSVSVIPHTAKATTLGRRGVGDEVNIEVDVIGKYVERIMKHESRGEADREKITFEWLREQGF